MVEILCWSEIDSKILNVGVYSLLRGEHGGTQVGKDTKMNLQLESWFALSDLHHEAASPAECTMKSKMN